MHRRHFLTSSVALTVGGLGMTSCGTDNIAARGELPHRNALPPWMGFNLQWMLAYSVKPVPLEHYLDRVNPQHLDWMLGWGFDFVRFGTSYWDLIDQSCLRGLSEGVNIAAEDVQRLDRERLRVLHKMVVDVLSTGLHVNLAMHRLPGDAVWRHELEPFSLYRDPRGDEAMAFWWGELAKAFADVPKDRLSFNLLNELPSHWKDRAGRDHIRRSMMIGVEAIRAVSPDRIIIVDGIQIGQEILDNMVADPVAHSLHAYSPFEISHVKTPEAAEAVAWPMLDEHGREVFGRRRLELMMAPFERAISFGCGVHCGEAGAERVLPARTFLPWMRDYLDILSRSRIGVALWQFTGGFGILDTGREDMRRARFHGHELDIELLEMLQAHGAAIKHQ